jgi:hypothetical protein
MELGIGDKVTGKGKSERGIVGLEDEGNCGNMAKKAGYAKLKPYVV